VSYKQIENSARPAEVKGSANNNSDLDDRLINQALDIMLNSRKNAVDNNTLSNSANCIGSTVANALKGAVDQASKHENASPSSRTEHTNSIRNAILNNLLDGTCERGPVIRNGRSDRAVIHENPGASTSEVIRSAAEGAIGGVIVGGAVTRIGRAAAEGAVDGVIVGGAASRIGRAAAEGAVSGAIIGGAASRAGRAAAEGAVRGAIIGGTGTEIGRAAAEGAIGGVAGGAASRIARALTEAGKDSEALPPVKNRSPRDESNNKEGSGEKSIQNQLPKSLKDILKEELKMPPEIFACVYRAPVEIRLDDEKGSIIKSPRDIIACAERIPKTGGKPEVGNYFACVHYYPLQTAEIKRWEKNY
jgi:hypothetical protein